MVEVAAHLTDHVLPPLPLRQWSFPCRSGSAPSCPVTRAWPATCCESCSGAFATLRRASPPAPGDAQLGAVSFLHRFGSALNPHFHYHVVVLDGVFSEGDDGRITFHEATHLTADDVLRLERTLQRRVLRLFQRCGLLTEHTVEDMLTWQASGGFSLDASVRLHGRERRRRHAGLPATGRRPLPLGAPPRAHLMGPPDHPGAGGPRHRATWETSTCNLCATPRAPETHILRLCPGSLPGPARGGTAARSRPRHRTTAASGHPSSEPIPCEGGADEGTIEGTINPGGSSLSYDAETEHYTYSLKTERNWGGTCRQLRLEFTDGQVRTADFRFYR
jgi:hypothetical protein